MLNTLKRFAEILGHGGLIGMSLSVILLFLLEMYFGKVYFYEPNKVILYSEFLISVLLFLYSIYSFKKLTKSLQ
jgi:hypothetical protein